MERPSTSSCADVFFTLVERCVDLVLQFGSPRSYLEDAGRRLPVAYKVAFVSIELIFSCFFRWGGQC